VPDSKRESRPAPATLPPDRPPIRIEHVAIWTGDLERLRSFYERYFDVRAGARYDSRNHPGFRSYFLELSGGGGRLELMTVPELTPAAPHPSLGYPHLAISLGSRDAVDALTNRMRADGVTIVTEAHETGDGYYESVVCDPDGNRIEITV
jgi:lactoylglutathione lyase